MRMLCFAMAVCLGWSLFGLEPQKEDVIPKLQVGGYVLFMCHPKTNPEQADTDPLHLENTKAQRQLTDEGRTQAKKIGEALRASGVSIQKVYSSKFHRAEEAATLLGFSAPETSADLTEGGLVVSPKENRRRAEALQQLLSASAPAGKNTIIVSHKYSLQDAAGKDFGDMEEGEIAIFQPLGDGKFALVARVKQSETWTNWLKLMP